MVHQDSSRHHRPSPHHSPSQNSRSVPASYGGNEEFVIYFATFGFNYVETQRKQKLALLENRKSGKEEKN
jgi:hypothetical protein